MKIFRHATRLIYINYIFLKHSLTINKTYGTRMRNACEDLGPIFIKFGQLLSTRRDLLSDEIISELTKLQDQVPPFCGKRAQKIIEAAFGKPINELFANFDTTPLASASIAQVHAANMLDGREVAVKILRPDIKKHAARDIDLLLFIARLCTIFSSRIRQFKPHAIVTEIRKSIFDELDLIREAANASQLRRNFTNSSLIQIPTVYWSHTRKNVLTLERMYGIPISNQAALLANKINLRCLAERGVEIFFTQVFRDRFFHADMHPGNVWVAPATPDTPQYIALDFGIVGTLSRKDQYYIAENFLAFFRRDYHKVAKLHVESGWVQKHIRIEEFESAIRCICEPIFEKPLKEISFGKILLQLFKTARQFEIEIQPQLILLQKTLLSVESIGRQLHPELDLWNTAKPFLEAWNKKRVKALAPYWLEKLPELPGLVYKALQNAPLLHSNALAMAHNSHISTANSQKVWYYFALGVICASCVLIISSRII